ncbi:MAG: putative aminohydrolase SsnA [Ignavibacteriae bacterium]|nr:MAG: putative aminohydrolase SsnA [Ignavibacteriota bacterium]
MILLTNGTILNFNPARVDKNSDIAIEGSKIIAIGKQLSSKYPNAEVVDLQEKIVMPGLVCAHNHFYSSLARGMMAIRERSEEFVEKLDNLWGKLDRALEDKLLYCSGMIGALEAIKSGTTAVIDHNSSPNFIKGSLSVLKEAFEENGLRGILCYEITNRNGKSGTKDGLQESLDFANSIKDNELIEAAIGGHATFTLSDDSLKYISDVIKKTGRGIHIHVGEDKYDADHSEEKYSKSILERLDSFNLLNDKSILAHGVWLNEKDLKILNKRKSFLVHNPRSNMNNNVGYLKSITEVKNLAIGTDGIGADMFEETRFAYFKSKEENRNLNPSDFVNYLWNGNTILERYFNQKFGKIEKGYTADLIISDYNSPTPLTKENAAAHFLFGFSSQNVESVLINGRFVYCDRAFPVIISKIYNKSKKSAKKLWEKMDEL